MTRRGRAHGVARRGADADDAMMDDDDDEDASASASGRAAEDARWLDEDEARRARGATASASASSRQRRAGRREPRERRNERRDRGGARPNVLVLTQRDYERVLPIAATGEQYGYFWGDNDTAFQRVGLSLLTTVLTANAAPALAVPASTFFLWAPVALAARRNSKVRSARYAGLWRARVISVEPVETRGTSSVDWMFNLVVGDRSGARVPLKVPLKAEYADINVGDDVELIVTSDDPYFYTFQAVREAYFPFLNVWVGEYPFLDRRGMVSVSDRLAGEEEARRAKARG